jgi:hypothetical protein
MPVGEMAEENLSEEKLRNNSVMRLQNWSLQQSGKLRPQEMEKIARGIKLIYPSTRRKCSRT